MTQPVPELVQEFDRTNPVQYWSARRDIRDLPDRVARLSSALAADRNRLYWYDAYYEGEQPLSYMSPAMAAEVKDLLAPVVLNWCRLGADMYSARLRIDGFRYAGDEQTDDELWSVWQANGLDRLMKQAVLEALALSRSYAIVGAPETAGDPPVITVESPFQVTALRDPRTRKVIEALKLWRDLDGQTWATLYEPTRTSLFLSDGSKWIPSGVDNHNLGMVPVVPFVNRPRLLRPNGVSEFHDVIPVVDAAIKMATDMMISGEYHAMPRRWVFGVKKSDFKDENGNAVSAWSRIASRIWSNENPDVKAGQFPEADLRNFHDTIKLLARSVAHILAAPDALTFDTVNPPSAESLGALNSERDMRVRDKQVEFGEAAEDLMRLVLRFQTGDWDDRAKSLETVWADPSTLTLAQKADATVKLVMARDGQGRSILPVEQAREDLGYGPIARKRMAELDEAAAAAALRALASSVQDEPMSDQAPDDAVTGV